MYAIDESIGITPAYTNSIRVFKQIPLPLIHEGRDVLLTVPKAFREVLVNPESGETVQLRCGRTTQALGFMSDTHRYNQLTRYFISGRSILLGFIA